MQLQTRHFMSRQRHKNAHFIAHTPMHMSAVLCAPAWRRPLTQHAALSRLRFVYRLVLKGRPLDAIDPCANRRRRRRHSSKSCDHQHHQVCIFFPSMSLPCTNISAGQDDRIARVTRFVSNLHQFLRCVKCVCVRNFGTFNMQIMMSGVIYVHAQIAV